MFIINMLSHGTLIKLAEMFGVSNPHGLCYGGIGMWMDALFSKDKVLFDARLEMLEKVLTKPQQLVLKIAKVRQKVKKKEKINKIEHRLLEAESFFQGQKAILDAYLPGGVGGDIAIRQTDIASKLKLFTDLQSITCVHQLTRVFTKTTLNRYLAELTPIIEWAQRETNKPFPLMLNANGHGIGLRYDNESATWVLFDWNALGKDYPHGEISHLSINKLTDEIFYYCDAIYQNQGFLIAGIQVVGYNNQDLRNALDVLTAGLSIQPHHHWVKDFDKKTFEECALSNNDNIELSTEPEYLASTLAAIEDGKDTDIEYLLDQLIDMELKEEEVVMLLMKSIIYKRDASIKKIMLLSQEPLQLINNPFLSHAIYQRGDLDCLNKVLCVDIDSPFLNPEGRQSIILGLLHKAALENSGDLVKELVARLDSTALNSSRFDDCLFVAAEVSGEITAVLLTQLMNKGLTIDQTRMSKLLKKSFIAGCLDVIQVLVDAGADLYFNDAAQFNALAMAIRYGKEDMVRWVFKKFKANKSNIGYLMAIFQPTAYGLNALDYAKLYCADVELAMIQKDIITTHRKLTQIELKSAPILGSSEIKLLDAAQRYDKFQQDTPLNTAKTILANYVKDNAFCRFFSGHWNRTTVHLKIVASILSDVCCDSPQKIIEKILDGIYQNNTQQDDPLMSIKKQTSSLHRRLNYLCMENGLVLETCIQEAEARGHPQAMRGFADGLIACV